jgi:hypothetical protein
MINSWLSLPLPGMIASLAGFYLASALLLIWLSFGRSTGLWVQRFKGVVAPFPSATMVLLAILVGFLGNDVSERNRRAAAAVQSESQALTTLYVLVSTSGLPTHDMAQNIRDYVTAVVNKEWPSMAEGQSAPEAELALDSLLETVAKVTPGTASNGTLDRILLDTALRIRAARAERLALSSDYASSLKWSCVLVLALMGQISLVVVHLERPRPQIAALAIFTTSIVVVIAQIATYESPFEPPIYIPPDPIAQVLKSLPDV